MSYTNLDIPSLAAILLSGKGSHYRLSEYSVANSLLDAEALIEQNALMNQWSSAEYRAQFKSSWNPDGEPMEIPF